MQTLDRHSKRIVGVARAVRAAVVVPSLLALALLVIEQPQMAGFAVFGTFAHLVMINYDTNRGARFAESVTLTLLGAFLVSLGTLASANIWAAVAAAATVGFLTECPVLARGPIAAIRTTLLLSLMVALAVPTSPRSVFPQLSGWLLAGLVAQPALWLLWFRIQPADSGGEPRPFHSRGARLVEPDGPTAWLGNAACTGVAMGLAVVLTRLLELEHAFWVVLGMLPVLRARGISAAHTFLQEQAGTLLGFLVSASLVAIIGAHQTWYWIILPFVVVASVYASSAVGFLAGQAAFTVFAVMLFCILAPQERWHVGILRVKDIAIGSAVSLLVGSLHPAAVAPVVSWITRMEKGVRNVFTP